MRRCFCRLRTIIVCCYSVTIPTCTQAPRLQDESLRPRHVAPLYRHPCALKRSGASHGSSKTGLLPPRHLGPPFLSFPPDVRALSSACHSHRLELQCVVTSSFPYPNRTSRWNTTGNRAFFDGLQPPKIRHTRRK
jgi:hypothetical protein